MRFPNRMQSTRTASCALLWHKQPRALENHHATKLFLSTKSLGEHLVWGGEGPVHDIVLRAYVIRGCDEKEKLTESLK